MQIVALTADRLAVFFAYLDDHLADNGSGGTALFQPLARAAVRLPDAQRAAFSTGMRCALTEGGWRRVWTAVDSEGAIAGHIDLRARPEALAGHRALLGMGVRRDARRQGVGADLLATAIDWARDAAQLTWIDLEVLSANAPARQLYERAGFRVTGEYPDKFRIDGVAHGMTHMSLPLRL